MPLISFLNTAVFIYGGDKTAERQYHTHTRVTLQLLSLCLGKHFLSIPAVGIV